MRAHEVGDPVHWWEACPVHSLAIRWSRPGENLKLVSTERSCIDIGAHPGLGHQPSHKPIPCTTKVKQKRLPWHLLAFVLWHLSLPGVLKKSEFSLTLEDQRLTVRCGCFLWKSAPPFPGNASTKLSWGDQVPPQLTHMLPINISGNYTGVLGNGPLTGLQIS